MTRASCTNMLWDMVGYVSACAVHEVLQQVLQLLQWNPDVFEANI